MKLRTLLILIILEGFVCLALLAIPASEPSSVIILRYSMKRLLLISPVLVAIAGIALFATLTEKNKTFRNRLNRFCIQLFGRETFLVASFYALVFGLFLTICVVTVWGFIDVFYKQIFFKTLPILIWLLIVGVQTIVYFFQWASQKNETLGENTIPITVVSANIKKAYNIKAIVLEVLVIVILTGSQYRLIARSYWRYRHLTIKYSPLLILGLIIMSRMIGWANQLLREKKRSRILFTGIVILGLSVLGYFYYQAASKHSVSKNVALYADQSSYVHQTKKVYETDFAYTGNRNQMPVYLFLQALFYDPETDIAEAFYVGKQVNIYLSLILLAVLFVVFRFFLPLHKALNLTLIIAFSSFIFKSAYFTSEILYYFLSFIGFLLLCTMFVKNSKIIGLFTGFILGVAHLTKASILPGLMLFAVIYTLKELFRWFSNRKDLSAISEKEIIRKRMVNLLLLIVAFIGTISPYAIESKKEYGQYLYNDNYIIMWYKSWGDALEARESYDGWHNIPPEEAPGALKYIRDHTVAHIFQRIQYGLERQTENIRYQFNFFNYPFFFALLVLLVFVLSVKKNLDLIGRNAFLIGFVVLYHLGYFMAFVWYSPIACLWRFIYGLHLPFMFTTSFAVYAMTKHSQLNNLTTVDMMVSIMLALDIYYVLTEALFLQKYAS